VQGQQCQAEQFSLPPQTRFHAVKLDEWSFSSLTMMLETTQVPETLVFNSTITEVVMEKYTLNSDIVTLRRQTKARNEWSDCDSRVGQVQQQHFIPSLAICSSQTQCVTF
jgi:hypothetical protein